MESAFAWIGKLMEWFGKFIPQIVLIRCTHAGVKFKWGRVVAMRPGLNFYWPLLTEIEIMPVARQTKNLKSQVLTTKDGQPVTLGVVIVYQIDDIIKVLADNWDINDTINDITQCAVVPIIAGQDYTYILEQLGAKIEASLSKVTRAKLKPFGVTVIRCTVTDFAKCWVTKRLVGD